MTIYVMGKLYFDVQYSKERGGFIATIFDRAGKDIAITCTCVDRTAAKREAMTIINDLQKEK